MIERGRLTAFVERHRLAWESSMAILTVLYVALSLLVDEGITGIVNDVIVVLAVLFFAEFSLRCWDAPSRLRYLRDHWIDLLTCLPAIGPLRLLRLVRLLGLLRLAHEIREVATHMDRVADSTSALAGCVRGPLARREGPQRCNPELWGRCVPGLYHRDHRWVWRLPADNSRGQSDSRCPGVSGAGPSRIHFCTTHVALASSR